MLIDLHEFRDAVRARFRAVLEVIHMFEEESADKRRLRQKYRKRITEFFLPLRGFAVAVDRGLLDESSLPAMELLYDFVGEIGRWEVTYHLPHVSTDIRRPIMISMEPNELPQQAIDDDSACDFVILHCCHSPDLDCQAQPDPLRRQSITALQVAAWATSPDLHAKELKRRFGKYWDEADEKFGQE